MQRFTSWIRYTLYLPLAVPLVVTPFTFFGAHFGKTMFFQLCIDLLVVAIGVLVISKKIALDQKALTWQKTTILDCVVVVFLAVLTLTSFTGIYPAISFWGNQARENGALLWIHLGIWYSMLKYFWNEQDWKRGFLFTTIIAVIVVGTAVFQNSLPLAWNVRFDSDRLAGILGNPAYLSLYLLPAFGCALIAGITALKGRLHESPKSIFAFASAVLIVGALVYTQSRGSAVGLGAGVITGIVLLIVLSREKKIRQRGSVLLITVCIAGALLIGAARTDWVHKNVPTVTRLFNVESFMSGTGLTRLTAWKIALQGFRDHPLLGSGLNSYEAIFTKYYNPIFLRYTFSETVWDKPHNWLLEIAVSSGIVGVMSYGALIAAAVWLALQGQYGEKKDVFSRDTIVSIILASTILGYAVQMLFLFETTNSVVVFFFLLSAVSSRLSLGIPTQFKAYYPTGFTKVGIVIVGLLFIILAYRGSVLPLRASYFLEQAATSADFTSWASAADQALSVPVAFRGEIGVFLAERFVNLDKGGVPLTSSAIETGVRVAESLEQESVKYPLTIAYPLWEAQLYQVLGEKSGQEKYLPLAESAAKKAAALSPQKQDVLFVLGRIYLLEKKFPEAIEVQKRAVEADSTVAISHWFLGLTYQAAGEPSLALNEIATAVKLGFPPSLDQQLYILDLYVGQKRYDEAIAGYMKIIAADPQNATWYVRVAALYATIGNKPKALEFAEKVAQVDPGMQPAVEQFIKENHLR
jgi:tetratricopeptide (TPR) repeat protein/O-antigen ligase